MRVEQRHRENYLRWQKKMQLKAASELDTLPQHMTKEDLQQIGELLEPINRQLESMVTKQDVKDIVEANNRLLGTILKVELASTNQEIVGVVKAGFQESTKQPKQAEQPLKQIAEDHEERITRLEEGADLTHKN